MNRLTLGMVLLAILVAMSMPTSAMDGAVDIDSLYRYEEVVPNGSYWLDWDKSGATTVNFNVPDVDLYKVRIYNSAWMPPDLITATYPNGTSPLPDRYPHIDNYTRYTGLGTCGVWYPNDTVKDATIPGAINTYSTSDSGHGTALIILYQDDSNPNSMYSWFYQGYDDVDHGQGWVSYSFQNVPASSATNWTLMLAVTCADNGAMEFNNNPLSGSGFNPSTKYYHVATHDVTGMVQNGVNTVEFDAVDDDYTHPYWMWLVGTTPDQQEPDITVDDIVIDPVTPRPGNNFMVNATILNQGDADAGPFNVSLYANDVLKGTEPVSGLVKDDNTTVSFTMNLPEDCYELKVVADVYDEVDESDEYNNESTVDGQVGYVIVVESDSDFDDLANDTGMPANSVTYDSGTDTYYIQDLTITNCAGDGIYITGTTKNFVIKGCTIENCAPDASGVFLNDVTKGTITGCTLQNNEAYGVELGLVPLDSEDPKFINITDNTIYQNGKDKNKNGIDLIGFNCIVKGNTIRDNGEYGIYVYGNDSRIYNNIIEENDNYGIKLNDSSGNHIYWNNFTNNNGGGVQGRDNRATNNWDRTTQIHYPYGGAIYANYTGNHWSDHTTPDSNGDGIVDTPYALDGGAGAEDPYPLMTLPWRFEIPIYENGDDPKNLFSVPLVSSTLDDVIDDPGQGDTVFRYYNDNTHPLYSGYKSAAYYDITWWDAEKVEPIEPTVGYEYNRYNGTFTINHTGQFPDGVDTPIHGEATTGDRQNLLGYASFNNTTLSTTFAGDASEGDTVFRYHNTHPLYQGYKSAAYYDGQWWDAEKVDPIEPGVGYQYDRYGETFNWTYSQ